MVSNIMLMQFSQYRDFRDGCKIFMLIKQSVKVVYSAVNLPVLTHKYYQAQSIIIYKCYLQCPNLKWIVSYWRCQKLIWQTCCVLQVSLTPTHGRKKNIYISKSISYTTHQSITMPESTALHMIVHQVFINCLIFK